jgi:hypothetical protein
MSAVVSNDPVSYPQDGPEGMRAQIDREGWSFPSLRDGQHALEAVLAGEPVPADLTPSLGCGIKWAEGLAPE